MRVKCYSVRLVSLEPISPLAYKAISYDGKSDIIPASQVFGVDYEVAKSEAYWISEWILERKKIPYSRKKEAWFDSERGIMLPSYIIKEHIPNKKEIVKNNSIKILKKEDYE